MRKSLLLAGCCFVVLTTAAFLMHSRDNETVRLRITSSWPDSSIVFESVITGAWNGQAPADEQVTPFEMQVDGDNFYGTFHKIGGAGQLQVELVGEEQGKTTWQQSEQYERLSLVVLAAGWRNVTGR